jgi:hypothetical protein
MAQISPVWHVLTHAWLLLPAALSPCPAPWALAASAGGSRFPDAGHRCRRRAIRIRRRRCGADGLLRRPDGCSRWWVY